MDLINEVIKIIIANKIIVTWIVILWLALVFFVIQKIHKKPIWKDWIRGIGEVTLGSLWMIMCVIILHFVPALAIMLAVTFSFYHAYRWLDDKRNGKTAPRKVVGPIVLGIGILAGWGESYLLGCDPLFDLQRGVAQLTSNTVFPNAGKSCKHWFACSCSYPLRATGIRPSEPQADSTAGSSFLPWNTSRKNQSSQTKKQQTPARSK